MKHRRRKLQQFHRLINLPETLCVLECEKTFNLFILLPSLEDDQSDVSFLLEVVSVLAGFLGQ